jgi:hypothetical protein
MRIQKRLTPKLREKEFGFSGKIPNLPVSKFLVFSDLGARILFFGY